MKNILVIIACLFGATCMAQLPVSYIRPFELSICSNKTTNIVFPFAIEHLDKGSTDVLVQKVTGAANVLELKASVDSFPETNVSVITSDGKLYSFIVNYAANPGELNIVIGDATVSVANNAKSLRDNATAIDQLPRSVHGVVDSHDEMRARLKGLYVQDDVFYFQLQFLNRSNVSYALDGIRFSVLDKRKSKRTATQETEIKPVYASSPQLIVGADEKPVMVVALPKFTLQDGKYLSIHITEKEGGRDLKLRMGNRLLVRALKIH